MTNRHKRLLKCFIIFILYIIVLFLFITFSVMYHAHEHLNVVLPPESNFATHGEYLRACAEARWAARGW